MIIDVCFFTQQEEFWSGKFIIEIMSSNSLSMIQPAILSPDSFNLYIYFMLNTLSLLPT